MSRVGCLLGLLTISIVSTFAGLNIAKAQLCPYRVGTNPNWCHHTMGPQSIPPAPGMPPTPLGTTYGQTQPMPPYPMPPQPMPMAPSPSVPKFPGYEKTTYYCIVSDEGNYCSFFGPPGFPSGTSCHCMNYSGYIQ